MSALAAAAADDDADTIAALKDRVAYLETLLKAATDINSVLDDDRVEQAMAEARAFKEAYYGLVGQVASLTARLPAPLILVRQQIPLTPDEITALSRQSADDPDDWPEPWAFHMGVVAAERHHGIREPKK